MKKLLMAISLMLIFGITSAAISFGVGSFDSAGTGSSTGGGGVGVAVARGTGGARGSSVDGGNFAFAQGAGVSGYYTLPGVTGGSYTATGVDGYAPAAQGSGLSFDGWLQRFADQNAQRTATGANGDSVGDGARHAYSVQAPVAGIQALAAASPGSGGGGGGSQEALLTTEDGPVTAVPEPESYAMLLAGLVLMAAVARRRNAGQS